MCPAEHCSDFCCASLSSADLCASEQVATLCMPWSEQGKVRSCGLRTAT